jgi:hypothetical protein
MLDMPCDISHHKDVYGHMETIHYERPAFEDDILEEENEGDEGEKGPV